MIATTAEKATKNLTLWIILAFASGFLFPKAFLWFDKTKVSIALAIAMLSMGLTISPEDFYFILKNPFKTITGVILQYTIMPLLGFLISKISGVSSEMAAGVILVSCCPGGVVSNIVSFLANADVALSVSMTSISTFLAMLLTPFLTSTLLNTIVNVDVFGLFISTLQVILLPVLSGILLKVFFPSLIKKITRLSPFIASIMVCLINASIIATNVEVVAKFGIIISILVSLLHLSGFLFGYLVSLILKIPEKSCRTNSIEVGMQNSGLGAVLATKHFPDPQTAAVCVISACVHSLFGSLLASYWRSKDKEMTDLDD